MENRLYFSQLAQELQIPGWKPPSLEPGAPVIHENLWRKNGGEKLLAYLKSHFNPGDPLEYDGHADCWLMLTMMYEMRQCSLSTYIGVFDRSLPIEGYQIGPIPREDQPCTFSVLEQQDNILLTVHLKQDGTPFDLPFHEIIAPELAQGKNIFVRLDGPHLLFTFPLGLTYGKTCRSLIMDFNDECFVSVSNTPELQVGDLVSSPFDRT